MISLLGLFLMRLPYLYGVALASSLTVLVMLAATMTLLPALLGFAGHGINRLPVPGMNRTPADPDHSRAARWARGIQRRPLITGVASSVLLAMRPPCLGIRFGFPDAGNDPATSTTRIAYDMVAKGFGPGANGALIAVATPPPRPTKPASFSCVTSCALTRGCRRSPHLGQAPPAPASCW